MPCKAITSRLWWVRAHWTIVHYIVYGQQSNMQVSCPLHAEPAINIAHHRYALIWVLSPFRINSIIANVSRWYFVMLTTKDFYTVILSPDEDNMVSITCFAYLHQRTLGFWDVKYGVVEHKSCPSNIKTWTVELWTRVAGFAFSLQ